MGRNLQIINKKNKLFAITATQKTESPRALKKLLVFSGKNDSHDQKKGNCFTKNWRIATMGLTVSEHLRKVSIFGKRRKFLGCSVLTEMGKWSMSILSY